MLAHDPGGFVEAALRAAWRGPGPLRPVALAEYVRALGDPDAIRAACEDYRAGATVDCAHEREDRARGRMIAAPTLLLWSAHGLVGRAFDPLEVWRGWCADLRGEALDCGHFLPEERPREVGEALLGFMGARGPG